MKAFVIVAQFALIIWLGTALVRVENERYALETGLCPSFFDSAAAPSQYFECIDTVETRTAPWWHLIYALGIF